MTSTQKPSARAATAKRASTFTESVIREMTRVANQYGASNRVSVAVKPASG